MVPHVLTFSRPLALATSLLSWSAAASETLYTTDFSEFTAGPDQLAGQQGWFGSHENEGLHGIDEDIYVGRERSAFLGGTAPSDGSNFVRVYHSIDPVEALGAPLTNLQFDVLFGIAASFEGGDDTFSFSFYSDAGAPLAAIHFDTSEFDYGIWTDDNAEIFDTGEFFLTDYLHHLHIEIDLESNRWEAELDGIAIFDPRPFTAVAAGDREWVIGALAAEWRIADPQDPGDNWLLFDDWTISGTTNATPAPLPTTIDIARQHNGHLEIAWTGIPGASYQVHSSTDGRSWSPAGAPVTSTSDVGSDRYVFLEATPQPAMKLYRVEPLNLQP